LRDEFGTGPEFSEALEFLDDAGFLGSDDLTELLRSRFLPPFRNDTRYSDGTFGVLYTALERETAASEYAHWAPVLVSPVAGRTIMLRLSLISCLFDGATKDVRPFLSVWPWLVSDDYGLCQQLSLLARADGLAALFAPSARRSAGTTTPIFADVATAPTVEGEVRFSVVSGSPTTFVFT
jgi:hypothetical protein